MLKKNDVIQFAAYAVQECGLTVDQLRDVVQRTEREFNRYNISEYVPIPAFEKTVLLNGKITRVTVCRWFFVSLVNWHLANGIPIPENVARYLPEVIRPMVVSKLRKYQKYDFLVTEQRIDESACLALETMFNTVEENQFLIPEKISYTDSVFLLNGKRVHSGVDAIHNLEAAKLAGDWVCLYKRTDSSIPFLSSMPRLNIVRAAISISCRKFVEFSLGRSVSQSNSTFEVTDSEDRLLNLIAKKAKPTEFPLGDFLHDENTSVMYRAVIYADSLHCQHEVQRFSAASEFCGKAIAKTQYYELLKKARKIARKYYDCNVVSE